MDIRFLESLITVTETGSIAAAARAQGLTATAISQRICVLETDLGVALLSRSAHSAQPTEACLNILPRARKLVQEALALKADADSTGLAGTLRVGAISTALTDMIPGLVKHLAEEAPSSDLSIFPGTSASLYDGLLKQELDCALLVEPPFQPPKSLTSQLIDRQSLVILSHEKKGASVGQIFKSNKLIVYDKNSWGGRIAWDWLMNQGQSFDVLCELDALETIAIMAAQGLGAAVVPKCAGFLKHQPDLTVTSLKTHKRYERRVSMLWNHSSHAKRLIELAIEGVVV